MVTVLAFRRKFDAHLPVGFRVQGSGLRVQGAVCRVEG